MENHPLEVNIGPGTFCDEKRLNVLTYIVHLYM